MSNEVWYDFNLSAEGYDFCVRKRVQAIFRGSPALEITY